MLLVRSQVGSAKQISSCRQDAREAGWTHEHIVGRDACFRGGCSRLCFATLFRAM